MGKPKNTLTALAVITLLVAGAWVTGWSPLNLVLGPQHRAQTEPKSDSRTNFLKETVPQQYPKLLRFLRSNGSETVSWNSQSGERQEQTLSLTSQQGLLIETTIFSGTSPAQARASTSQTPVRMTDGNLDGVMDSITYVDQSGQTHRYGAPFDETSQYLWDSSGTYISIQ